MPDSAVKYTDEQMEELKKRIREIFGRASVEVKRQMDEFYAASKKRDQKMRADLKAGKITKETYQAWLKGQVFQGKWWEQRLHDITAVYVNADQKSKDILDGVQKNVFVEAANFTAFQIEQDFSGAVAFNLYDRTTVTRLLKDNPQMLPEWRIDEPKDYIWNERRVQNAVTQGIIQGDAISDIARRLSVELSTSNEKKMTLFARTAMTGAQNAGRVERMRQADAEFGIKCKKQWISCGDNRVRDSHQFLDGKIAEYDESFFDQDGRRIDFPGDPTAEPDLVYNCRCSLLYLNKHMHGDYRLSSHTLPEYEAYNEWKRQKYNQEPYKIKFNDYGPVQSRNT